MISFDFLFRSSVSKTPPRSSPAADHPDTQASSRSSMCRQIILTLALTACAQALSLPTAATGRRGAIAGFLGVAVQLPPMPVKAESSSVFLGRYTDPINHPGGFREISFNEPDASGRPASFGPYRLATVKGGQQHHWRHFPT